MNAYICPVAALDASLDRLDEESQDASRSAADGPHPGARWELYRLLADPVRLRVLALTSVEELGVGELAELLGEGQPKISRHASSLRDAGLLRARKQGTWTLLRVAAGANGDPVVADAINAGMESCRGDGTLARVERILVARESATRDFFARASRTMRAGPPTELGAYLAALAPLLPDRELAIDVGTGSGSLLEVLSPLYHRVVAVDRAPAQLALAAERMRLRELGNVTLVEGEIDGPEIGAAIANASGNRGDQTCQAGADLVFASRVLHHAKAPARALQALATLLRPPENGRRGGALAIVDYETHDDSSLGKQQADLWLGFAPEELCEWSRNAGIDDISWRRLPAAWCGEGPDHRLRWQLVLGFRSAQGRVEGALARKPKDSRSRRRTV
jgi:ArsR family transcriptional regulator